MSVRLIVRMRRESDYYKKKVLEDDLGSGTPVASWARSVAGSGGVQGRGLTAGASPPFHPRHGPLTAPFLPARRF